MWFLLWSFLCHCHYDDIHFWHYIMPFLNILKILQAAFFLFLHIFLRHEQFLHPFFLFFYKKYNACTTYKPLYIFVLSKPSACPEKVLHGILCKFQLFLTLVLSVPPQNLLMSLRNLLIYLKLFPRHRYLWNRSALKGNIYV